MIFNKLKKLAIDIIYEVLQTNNPPYVKTIRGVNKVFIIFCFCLI